MFFSHTEVLFIAIFSLMQKCSEILFEKESTCFGLDEVGIRTISEPVSAEILMKDKAILNKA